MDGLGARQLAVEGDATWIDESGREAVEENCERAAVAEVDEQVVDAEQPGTNDETILAPPLLKFHVPQKARHFFS